MSSHDVVSLILIAFLLAYNAAFVSATERRDWPKIAYWGVWTVLVFALVAAR
jgi:hypothetical protein